MEEILKNNSASMKTEVETYLIEETTDLIYDNEQLDKWNEHVKVLGLEGQKNLSQPDKSPIPFMHMKQSVVNIFDTLCPRKVEISKYDITPIPVEILDLAALSVTEKYFNEIQIWYDDKEPDPACVGVLYQYYVLEKGRAHKDYTTFSEKEAQKKADKIGGSIEKSWGGGNHYLIGRWADVKRPIDELKEMAKKRFIEERKNEAERRIKDAQREIDDIDIKAAEHFN